MVTADPLIGSTLDHRYRIESTVAGGGMATVYVARDTRLDRRLACKVMHASLAQDPVAVRRFINEAHSVARLSHPNVVQVFDQGTDQGHVYLAMEYVPGRTLREVLDERGNLPAAEALGIMGSMLAALGAAHNAGIVHRDVKPENVLLTEDNRVKVADFGLARAGQSNNQQMTRTGTVMGTAAYLAPEQIEQGSSDTRSDVYAAGIMLYELLTGAQPHTGENAISVAYQHVNADVPRPSATVPGLPDGVDRLVTKATERDPRYRPADANQYLSEVLEAAQAASPQPNAPVEPTLPHTAGKATPGSGNETLVVDVDSVEDDGPGSRRWWSRWPALVVAGALALVLIAFGWWFLFGRYEQVPDVVGATPSAAEEQLAEDGLRLKVDDNTVYSDDAREGEIASAAPAIGDRVLPGEAVTVVVSKGPRTVDMPDVTNSSAEDARSTLEDAGFSEFEEKDEASREQPVGTVLATDPAPGDNADREESVTLTVSSGVEVPSVTGMDEDEARSELEDQGLGVEVTEQSSEDVAEGEVMEQDPASGDNVSAGDTVTLTVSSGEEEFTVPDVTGWKVKDAREELEDLGLNVEVNEILGGGQRVNDYSPTGTVTKGDTVELLTTPIPPPQRGGPDDG
ncbi:serine/threonine-protein kinase [Haloactinospora alba]|uniref:non-specific serine/threonine protein kinase n=2 Tax=Haloactinospora alba TaxID=405555 RepID=A0A543NHK0_9ACTN|nr:serine/threonine-protein kinase [Haloactinospora alba]